MRLKLFMIALVAVFGVADTASAQLSYSMTSSQSISGSVDTVSVYLVETTNGAAPYIGPGGNGGLFGAAFGINTISGNAVITGIGSNAAFQSNSNGSPTFTNQVQSGGAAAAIYEAAPPGTPTSGLLQGTATGQTGVSQLFLGSFQITIGSAPTVFNIAAGYAGSTANSNASGAPSLIAQPPGGTELAYGTATTGGMINGQSYTGAYDNDPTFGTPNSTYYQFTVAAVPEPSSMLLCGFAVCGMGYTAYRRRKATSQLPVVTA